MKKKNYFIPDFDFNYLIDDRLSAGLSVIGNGVGTKYARPIGPPTNSNAGSELMQVVMSPTLAYKLNPNNAIGIPLNFAYQRMMIEGVEHTGLSNQKFEQSFGYGFAVGWTGKINDYLTRGASYISKTRMGRLDKYRILLAGNGEFDIPERFSAGIAITPIPGLTIAADAMKASWSVVKSLGNSLTLPGAFGASNGLGFGWKDQEIYRVSVNDTLSDTFELRGG